MHVKADFHAGALGGQALKLFWGEVRVHAGLRLKEWVKNTVIVQVHALAQRVRNGLTVWGA
jgi:hypothetical protein